jgi:small-conductance mechanosensitive channel
LDINLEASFQELLTDLIAFVPKLIVALITFTSTLLLSGPIARAVRRVTEGKIENEDTLTLITRLTRWTVVIVGTLVALDQVDFDITGFVAGLGIAGITIGFALQDIAKNFVAGLLLFARQPFQIGDMVNISEYTGSVLDITTRDTVIRTLDGERVILSNTEVLENPIVNYTDSKVRRRTVYIGLGYGQDVEKAIGTFREAMAKVSGVLQEPAPTVYAEELGDATINLAARYWVDTTTDNLLDVQSNVVIALDRTAGQEGIDLPYPIQTVRVENAG